jgi:hypothetical protein
MTSEKIEARRAPGDFVSGEAARSSGPEAYAVHASARQEAVHDCFVELHHDGSVVLVVDGERLFRMDSFEALLEHYRLERGRRRAEGLESAERDARDARDELHAAEEDAMVELTGIVARPRADKALIDPGVQAAIERVRAARARVEAMRGAPDVTGGAQQLPEQSPLDAPEAEGGP